jgi:hypothetical protein
MTGLKQIENQRAFEAAHDAAKEEPSYKLLEEIYDSGILTGGIAERTRVYLATGVLNGQYKSQ